MEWLSAHWQYVLVAFYVAEKIVKLTPTQYDDIVLDIVVSGAKKLVTGK